VSHFASELIAIFGQKIQTETLPNLLDLAAIAVPGGFRPLGIPVGITLVAPAFQDDLLVDLALAFHRRPDVLATPDALIADR
jgi:Asp-tRNA(Asn)/Glu-tRNA(Gln) amidotransferase A subunit family amidase